MKDSCYSPDLNPIEMVFAKLKTLFRKADGRLSRCPLKGAIEEALIAVP